MFERRRILVPTRRPQGVKGPQGQSDNLVFNPPSARLVGYENFNVSVGRTIPLAAGQSLRALPANKLRTMITIANYDGANDLFYRFGANATATEGNRLVAGGVAFYDTLVPNQDLWVFSTLGLAPGVWIEEVTFQRPGL